MPEIISCNWGRIIEGVNVLISYTRMIPSKPPVMICVVSSLKQQPVTWNEWGRVLMHSWVRSSHNYNSLLGSGILCMFHHRYNLRSDCHSSLRHQLHLQRMHDLSAFFSIVPTIPSLRSIQLLLPHPTFSIYVPQKYICIHSSSCQVLSIRRKTNCVYCILFNENKNSKSLYVRLVLNWEPSNSMCEEARQDRPICN